MLYPTCARFDSLPLSTYYTYCMYMYMQVSYTVSGDWLSVDERSGAVTLREKLDRESEPGDGFAVVVTVQDEENLIPYRRQIKGGASLVHCC